MLQTVCEWLTKLTESGDLRWDWVKTGFGTHFESDGISGFNVYVQRGRILMVSSGCHECVTPLYISLIDEDESLMSSPTGMLVSAIIEQSPAWAVIVPDDIRKLLEQYQSEFNAKWLNFTKEQSDEHNDNHGE